MNLLIYEYNDYDYKIFYDVYSRKYYRFHAGSIWKERIREEKKEAEKLFFDRKVFSASFEYC
jgi:hypothetical protein